MTGDEDREQSRRRIRSYTDPAFKDLNQEELADWIGNAKSMPDLIWMREVAEWLRITVPDVADLDWSVIQQVFDIIQVKNEITGEQAKKQ